MLPSSGPACVRPSLMQPAGAVNELIDRPFPGVLAQRCQELGRRDPGSPLPLRCDPAEATCITEMSVMMACWKQNEFRDEACRKEIQDFFDCASKAEAARKMRSIQGEYGNLPPQKVNMLLQRFPNKSHLS
ncbi:PREDICTED: coiled-coil-helix-coiled-coil-helix domain-containing protein 1 [Myotis brandtii]|nr:PREDICTED: coiled-coil-helix-coiled-coil-helix domain-containing protein 1 [Myotis brandtii]